MALNSIGGVYRRQNKYDEAVQAFKQSSEIEQKINNPRGLSMVLNSLGSVYQRQGKFVEAVQAFQQSYKLLVKLVDERGQAMVLNSLGGIYSRQKKYNAAFQAFQQSAKIEKKNNNQRGLAMVLTSWGQALLSCKMPEKAIEQLNASFSIDLKLKNKRGLEIVTPLLCRTLQQISKNEEANLILDQAIKIAPRNKRLLKFKKELQNNFSNSVPSHEIKEGVIKRIINKETGFRFGFIVPDDESMDIYFGETQVAKDLRSKLEVGLRVLSEIEVTSQGPRAKRVWTEEDG